MNAFSTFKGHDITQILINIASAFVTIPAIWSVYYSWGYWDNYKLIILLVITYPFFARPTYLFFELKHLLLKDGIADERDWISIVVFGGMSLLGLFMQVVTNAYVIYILNIPDDHFVVWIIALGFISSFGACLGLTDLDMIEGILWPPSIIKHSLIVLKRKSLCRVLIATTFLVSALPIAIKYR